MMSDCEAWLVNIVVEFIKISFNGQPFADLVILHHWVWDGQSQPNVYFIKSSMINIDWLDHPHMI